LVTVEQDKLAALRQRCLERNDEIDPGGRVYIHKETGDYFHSVTRILSATMAPENKKALEKWLERPDSIQTRDMAAARGTAAHNSAEYVLKTAQRLARSTANKRNVWRVGEDGLYRAPEKITKWALEKAIQGAPKVPWSASGFARGLRGWILDHVTAIHSVEFSAFHPAGFAGACDALLDLDGKGPFIVDWKTTGKSIHASIESQLANYRDQTGAYSLMLHHRTGIQAVGGAVVVARRSGAPTVTHLDINELRDASERFLGRCADYYADLPLPGAP
jgi:hypothetical protein